MTKWCSRLHTFCTISQSSKRSVESSCKLYFYLMVLIKKHCFYSSGKNEHAANQILKYLKSNMILHQCLLNLFLVMFFLWALMLPASQWNEIKPYSGLSMQLVMCLSLSICGIMKEKLSRPTCSTSGWAWESSGAISICGCCIFFFCMCWRTVHHHV